MEYASINEVTARRSKEMSSFSDYAPGSATAAYRAQVDEAASILEEVKKKCQTKAQQKTAEYHFARYCSLLASYINRENEIGTRCPSVMIAGPANFPVRKKEKQVAAWDSNRATYEAAVSHLEKMRSAHRQGIQSNDPEALEALTAKLESEKAFHATMVSANAYCRKNGTLSGFPGFSPASAEEVMADMERLGLRRPYSAWSLQNSSARIKRLACRIDDLTTAKHQPSAVQEVSTVEGLTYKEDAASMRVKLVFDGKPDEETRALLKSNGFRWAPSVGAWQRQLTDNGKRAARSVLAALAQK